MSKHHCLIIFYNDEHQGTEFYEAGTGKLGRDALEKYPVGSIAIKPEPTGNFWWWAKKRQSEDPDDHNRGWKCEGAGVSFNDLPLNGAAKSFMLLI